MSRPPEPVRLHRRRLVHQLVAQARLDWKRAACRGGCVMCRHVGAPDDVRRERGRDLGAIEGHHVLPQQQLKRHGHTDKLWDLRNGMGLCAYHHARHGNYAERVPRELLTPEHYEFADELGLAWLLDREYPPT